MRHSAVLVVLLFLFCSVFSEESLRICRFKDGKRAALSLTFDDGTRDHLLCALPLLERYGFKGTFYIIIRRVPERVNDPSSPTGYVTWDELRRFVDAGHEIGNHSLSHRRPLTRETDRETVRREINAPIPVFRKKLGIDVETFCYPGCSSSPEIEAVVLEHHLGASFWRYPCGGPSFSIRNWRDFLDRILARGEDAAAMIHSIVPEAKGWMPFASLEQFDQFLREAKRREPELWVDTYSAVLQYRILRDNSVLKILSDTDQEITGVLESRTSTRIRTPLTLEYTGGNLESVEQNGKRLPVRRKGNADLFDVHSGTFHLRKRPSR